MTDYEQAPDFEDEEEDEELKVYTEVGHEVPGRPPLVPSRAGRAGMGHVQRCLAPSLCPRRAMVGST